MGMGEAWAWVEADEQHGQKIGMIWLEQGREYCKSKEWCLHTTLRTPVLIFFTGNRVFGWKRGFGLARSGVFRDYGA